jgi:outer membrane protein
MKKLLPLFVSIAISSTSANVFADTLANIYDQAKQNDPQLLSSQAQRDSAYEAIKLTRGNFLPQISLSTGYNIVKSNYDPADSSRLTAGVNLSQEIYNRSSWINLDTAEKNARMADSKYAADQQSLILRVSQAYFEVLRAQDSLESVRAEKNAVARQLEQTKQRFDVGLSAITDVHEAQAQYDSVLADEVLAENNLANSYEALREITGTEHESLSQLDTNKFKADSTVESVDVLLDSAKNQNLELLSSRISQDIARDSINLSDSKNLPSVSLDAGYTLMQENDDDNSYRNIYDPINNASVGITLSVPLYTGGKITSQTKQAEYGYIQASQQLEATYRNVVKNVHAYYNNINASIGAIKAYQQTVVSASSALKATEAGFDVGTRTIVDVLDSTRRLYEVNRNLSNSRYDYIINRLMLRQTIGTLSEQDIIDINTALK